MAVRRCTWFVPLFVASACATVPSGGGGGSSSGSWFTPASDASATGDNAASTGTCKSECAAGATTCTTQGLIQSCGKGANGCLQFSSPSPCPTGQVCSGTSCVKACNDDCTEGTGKCGPQGLQACAKGSDGCTHWQPPQFCPSGQVCEEGVCGPCKESSQCDAASICAAGGACATASGHTYKFTFISGKVPSTDESGAAWDAFGGAPDPKVTVYVNDKAVGSTSYVSDTFEPVWNETVTTVLKAGDSVELGVWDIDTSEHDWIDGVKFKSWLATVKAGGLKSGPIYEGSKVSLTYSITPK